MAMPSLKRSPGWVVILILGFVLSSTALIWIPIPTQAGDNPQETVAYCLSCHSNQDLEMTLPGGEVLPLFISPERLNASVHSQAGIECEACHTEITTYPHPDISYTTRRELARDYYHSCRKCHIQNYEKSLDSMHANAAVAGNLDAPVCTDCHGAHDVRDPDEPRPLISTTCGKCHTEISDEYESSVHGGMLIEEDNPDVPVCTDCHGVHNIHDPRTAQFRVDTPDLCAHCHADKEMMKKYGLSTDVYSLYETSWHGVEISVYKANWPTIWHDSAVCTDCHGVHNIYKTDDPKSMVNPLNLLATCSTCHPGAGNNWTDAWTGHNQISLQRTPMLFYVDAFYKVFIPIILWACAVYVALQIIRANVERVRRSLP